MKIKNIVLIWASNNPEKYWNKILKDLISKGYNIYPINPKEETIEWMKVYKNLDEISFDYEVVNFVVKPEITLNILKNNIQLLKNKKIWCQPWSSNEEIKQFLEDNNFSDYITDSCIMVQKIN